MWSHACSACLGRAEIFERDVFAADENLSVLGELYLLGSDRFANRSTLRVEGMIRRDERARLREPVALDEHESEPPPQRFVFGGEVRAAGKYGPELPTKSGMHVAVAPPAREPPEDTDALAARIFLRLEIESALELAAQARQEPGHRGEHRDPLAPDRLDDCRGMDRVHEGHRASHHNRDEEPGELSEDMTQRQEVEKADRLERASIERRICGSRFGWARDSRRDSCGDARRLGALPSFPRYR